MVEGRAKRDGEFYWRAVTKPVHGGCQIRFFHSVHNCRRDNGYRANHVYLAWCEFTTTDNNSIGSFRTFNDHVIGYFLLPRIKTPLIRRVE
jgi:hypothetical protein